MSRRSIPAADEALALEVRNTAHELMTGIVSYFHDEKEPVNEIIFVPTTIMSRIFRTHDAIGVLLKNNHPSEAAVLTLTQFELRLDIAHTASDIKHSTAWLDHEDKKWSLLAVKNKIATLFSEGAERADLYSIFQNLSGIKHGNPVYSELAFPAHVSDTGIVISTGESADAFTEEYANMILGYSTYQVAWSSHVLNDYVARYALVDPVVRRKIRDLASELHLVQREFCEFLEDLVSRRKTAFGMKARRRHHSPNLTDC